MIRVFGYVVCVCFLFVVGHGWGCGEEPQGPKTCTYEHECGDNERCIYEDPSCVALTGQCKGVCTPQEPIPEKACECQKDEDCKNFPSQGCADCKCIPRPVLRCNTDADCIRGWYCLGEPGKGVCQARSTCKKDEDCPYGYACRDDSCCDLQTNNCPSTCQEGTACESDVDCYFCNMRCKNKQCTFDASDPCAGVKCVNDADCATCNGKCAAGYCQSTGTQTCIGKSCALDTDCAECGSNCSNGTCQEKSQNNCTTLACVSDADCTASGLKSCIEKCCQ